MADDELSGLIQRISISETKQEKDAAVDSLAAMMKSQLKIEMSDEYYRDFAIYFAELKIKHDRESPRNQTATSFAQNQNDHETLKGADTIRLQSTLSTDSTTSDEYTSGGSRLNTPRGFGRAHDMDGTGASQPMNARSPMRPSADEQRQPPAARSHRYTSSDPCFMSKSPGKRMPDIFAPPHTFNTNSTDSFQPISSAAGSNTNNEPTDPVVDHNKPAAVPNLKSSPKRTAVSPARRRPESLRPPSSPGMNRPGLQENDVSGIAQSPKTQWGPSSHASLRKEDDTNGAAEPKSDDGFNGIPLFANCPPPGGPPMPQPNEHQNNTNPHDGLFTPRGVSGPSSAGEVFKTANHKNRRKDGTPFSMSGESVSNQPNSAATDYVESSFPASKFDATSFANAFNTDQVNTNRGRIRSKFKKKNNLRRNDFSLNTQVAEDITSASDTDAMDIDPNSPLASAPMGGFDSNAVFQMGTGGSGRLGKARSSRRANLSSQPTMPAGPAPPPDLSAVIDKIQELREQAKDLYNRKDYAGSIHIYTSAIIDFGHYAQFLKDNLAVLHSNRAAALMMVGAFEACAWDCDRGLEHVTTDRDQTSSDGGLSLRVKLLTRFAKAHFKMGGAVEARNFFTEAVNTANTIANPSDVLSSVLNQCKAEAAMGVEDSNTLNELLEKIRRNIRRFDSMTPVQSAEVLRDISRAVVSAPGSHELIQFKLMALSKMRRWRELAGFCERVAANNLRYAECFVGDLEDRNPLPNNTRTANFQADVFNYEYNETDETAELKLNRQAAAEAVFRMPSFIIPKYLRCLRLEERYPAAESCLNALQEFVRSDNHRFNRDRIQQEFQWIEKEKDKLLRTKTARERGDEFFRKGDFEMASILYANCLAIDAEGATDGLGPTNNEGGRLHAVLHCNRAACFMALGHHKEALKDTIHAMTIHEKYMKAMLRRARCHRELGELPEAISEFKRWIQLVEDSRAGKQPGLMGAPCIFDLAKDVEQKTFEIVQKELHEVSVAHRKSQQVRNEERNRARSNSRFAHSQSFNSGATSDAQRRRDEWQRQDSRRYDSFRSRGPRSHARSQSSDPRARSSNYNDGSDQSHRSRREKSVDSPRTTVGTGRTYYDVLGLHPSCSDSEIRKKFLQLSKKYHPDKKTGDPDKMVELNEAHEELRDPEKRRRYDVKMGLGRRY